jgi:hypothetical protein
VVAEVVYYPKEDKRCWIGLDPCRIGLDCEDVTLTFDVGPAQAVLGLACFSKPSIRLIGHSTASEYTDTFQQHTDNLCFIYSQ